MLTLSPIFTGVPSFFRCCCRDVSRGRIDASYSHPGYELARHLSRLVPYEAEFQEWLDILEAELWPLIESRDDEAVIKWLLEHYPRCMALVPRRRRDAFLQGFYQRMIEDEGMTDT